MLMPCILVYQAPSLSLAVTWKHNPDFFERGRRAGLAGPTPLDLPSGGRVGLDRRIFWFVCATHKPRPEAGKHSLIPGKA